MGKARNKAKGAPPPDSQPYTVPDLDIPDHQPVNLPLNVDMPTTPPGVPTYEALFGPMQQAHQGSPVQNQQEPFAQTQTGHLTETAPSQTLVTATISRPVVSHLEDPPIVTDAQQPVVPDIPSNIVVTQAVDPSIHTVAPPVPSVAPARTRRETNRANQQRATSTATTQPRQTRRSTAQAGSGYNPELTHLKKQVTTLSNQVTAINRKMANMEDVSRKLDLLLGSQSAMHTTSSSPSQPPVLQVSNQNISLPSTSAQPVIPTLMDQNVSLPSTSAQPVIPSLMDQPVRPQIMHQQQDVSTFADQSIQSHIQQLINSDNLQDPGEHFLSVAMPLDVEVSDKVKSSIWALEYIDFSKLREPDTASVPVYDIDISSSLGSGKVRLNTGKQPNNFTNIAQWYESFHIFMSVYCQKYPHESLPLLSYQYTIKSIANDGGDWLRYDIQFRKLFRGRKVPWNKPHVELYMKCNKRQAQARQAQQPYTPPQTQTYPKLPTNSSKPNNNRSFRSSRPNQQSNSKAKSRHPLGSCFDYHDYGKCTKPQCSYVHACYSQGCDEAHPIFTCSKYDSNPVGYVRSQSQSKTQSQARPNQPAPNPNKAKRA